MRVATAPTRFPDDLMPEEADVLQRVAAMPVDLPSMAAVANIWRAAQAARAYLEREVLRPRDLSWAGFSLPFNLWVGGSMGARGVARLKGDARARTLDGRRPPDGHRRGGDARPPRPRGAPCRPR